MIPSSDFPWTLYLRWSRALLAAAAVAMALAGLSSRSSTPAIAILIAYLAGSVLAGIRSRGHGGLLGMLALFADAVYFLIVVYFGAAMIWLSVFFFLYLMIEAVAFSGPVEVAVITAVSAIFCMVLRDADVHLLEPMVLVSGVLSCGFSIFKGRQQSLAKDLGRRLDMAVKAAEKARDEETHRIAADFHDGPLQSFISLQMRLEILRKIFERDSNAGMQDLKELQALAQSQVRDLRTFLHSMRPADVDGGNLVVTLRRTAESFQKESGIPVTFVSPPSPVGLNQEVTMEVLQMLREALHNVQKHASATRVAVTMEKTERTLELSVDDNGHGFNFAGTYSLEELELLRLGPASLKRRARSLSADLLLESRPGRGAGIKFRIPLQ